LDYAFADPEPVEQVAEEGVEPMSGSRWSFLQGFSFFLSGFDEDDHNKCVEYIEVSWFLLSSLLTLQLTSNYYDSS